MSARVEYDGTGAAWFNNFTGTWWQPSLLHPGLYQLSRSHHHNLTYAVVDDFGNLREVPTP